METLTATLKVVTPLFLGGADTNNCELRAPSIKGALRFWYRAIDPEYKKNEPAVFGSTEVQSSFFIAIKEPDNSIKTRWNKDTYKSLSVDSGKQTKNGIIYLGFSHDMKPNKRKYINPDQTIDIVFTFKPGGDNEERLKAKQALLASLWLLGHVGGLGSRSRRGFGTVALTSWAWKNGEEITLPPIAHGEITVDDWLKKFKTGLGAIKEWYKTGRTDDATPVHTAFSNKTKGDCKRSDTILNWCQIFYNHLNQSFPD